MPQLYENGIFSVNDLDGSVGAGWELNFYASGTTTRIDTYPTSADAEAHTNPNQNPVLSDASGRFPPIWLVGGGYKVVLKDSTGVTKVSREATSQSGYAVAIEDFGGIPGGIIDNATAFAAADISNQSVRIKGGNTYYTTYLPTGMYYGEGTIQYNSELIIVSTIPGHVNTPAVGSSTDDSEDGEPAQSNRAFNISTGIGSALALSPLTSTASTIIGTRAGATVTSISRLTAYGFEVFQQLPDAGTPYSNVGVGASVASRSAYAMRCTFVGDNAGKWSGCADPVGELHDFFRADWSADMQGIEARNPTARTDAAIGPVTGPASTVASDREHNARNVSIGRNSGIHAVRRKDSVSVGYRAAANQWNVQWNTDIGRQPDRVVQHQHRRAGRALQPAR